MDLSSLAPRLKVNHKKAVEKAKEYQRLMQQKASGIPITAEALSIGCLELGCKLFVRHSETSVAMVESLRQRPAHRVSPSLCVGSISYHVEIDHPLFAKYSCCKTPAAYSKILHSMEQTLGIQQVVTTKELSIQNGCIQANDMARKVLQTYKEKMHAAMPRAGALNTNSSSLLPADQKSPLDARNVYPIVAFYLSCKHLKITIDRKRLTATHNIGEKEFLTTIESFYTHIPELRPAEKKQPAPRKANAAAGGGKGGKKRKSMKDDGEEEEVDESKECEFEERKSRFSDEPQGNDEYDAEGSMEDDCLPLPPPPSSQPQPKGKNLTEAQDRWHAEVSMAEDKLTQQTLDQPRAKKRKAIPTASLNATSASPADTAAAKAVLKQARLNFGSSSNSNSRTKLTKQLKHDSGDEGEAEFEG